MDVSIDEVRADVRSDEKTPPPSAEASQATASSDPEAEQRWRAARQERLRERLRAF